MAAVKKYYGIRIGDHLQPPVYEDYETAYQEAMVLAMTCRVIAQVVELLPRGSVGFVPAEKAADATENTP
jgi:hypothetical protein